MHGRADSIIALQLIRRAGDNNKRLCPHKMTGMSYCVIDDIYANKQKKAMTMMTCTCGVHVHQGMWNSSFTKFTCVVTSELRQIRAATACQTGRSPWSVKLELRHVHMQVYGLLFTRTSKYFFQLGQKKRSLPWPWRLVHLVFMFTKVCETPASPSYIHLNLDK
jgi:hypothetical protein